MRRADYPLDLISGVGCDMNKEHWISVLLSGPLSAEEIHDLLAESYELTSK
ncbi:MmcQ/YjbR family DNA-binding protein [Yersinia enterocolitica]